MNRFERSICFLPLLLLFLVPNLWAATSSSPSKLETRENPPTLVEHLRTELRSKTLLRQERALADVISLGMCSATCTVELQSLQQKKFRLQVDPITELSPIMDLTVLGPDLLRIYHTGRTDEVRLMALSAIMGQANEATIESLISMPSSQSERVREFTRRVVVNFFVTMYPELLQNAQRRGTVSLEEIAELRSERDRQVRRAARRAAEEAKQAAKEAEKAAAAQSGGTTG